jgi:hypothetical protein
MGPLLSWVAYAFFSMYQPWFSRGLFFGVLDTSLYYYFLIYGLFSGDITQE